jgi:glycine hydroxymethyltransferase
MDRISDIVARHEGWRSRTLNLIPSENVTSPALREMLASDLGHRYTFRIDAYLHGHVIENAYRGTRWTEAVEERVEELLRDLYGAEGATARPLSGHVAGMTALAALVPKGGTVMALRPDDGGYDGYHPPHLPDLMGYTALDLPFDEGNFRIDTDGACDEIRGARPDVVVLNQSFVLFPPDIAPIDEVCQEGDAHLLYDGSHTLGLMAGGDFQPDAVENSDLFFASTHKTLFGPQGGLMVSRSGELLERVRKSFTLTTQDNAHWNRIAALGVALEEMRVYGARYAYQVISNAKALAHALHEGGLPVRFPEHDFTESHQLLLDTDWVEANLGLDVNSMANRLEGQDIIVDAMCRLGTNEMTRRGMTEPDMERVAELVVRAANGEAVAEEVHALVEPLGLAFTLEH